VINYSHREFDVTKEQMFDIIKYKNIVFENNTLNEDMLNDIQRENNKKNDLHFGLIFFNLLTMW